MSAGNVGSVVVDLDADLSKYAAKLSEARADAEKLIKDIEGNAPKLDLDTGKAREGLDNLGTSATTASTKVAGIGESGAKTGSQIRASLTPAQQAVDAFSARLLPVPLGFAGVGIAAAGAGIAVGKFGVDSVQTFFAFEQAMAEVFTLMPQASADATAQMTEDARDFATSFGVDINQAVQGLYDALSAGVPQDNVFQFLETAQKAATAGVTDLTTTVAGVSSVINAYGADVITAAEASDLMFTAVVAGQTTFEELSRNLADVTPLSAALGVSFSDVTAALATMTAQGTKTTVATTQLRSLLVELSDSGTVAAKAFSDVAGVSFQQFIDQGHSVADALVVMQDAADKAGVPMQEMFGSIEAGIGALSLSGGNIDAFNRNLNAMETAAGATETAYDTMADTGSQSLRDLSAAWTDLKLTLGDGLAEPVAGMAEGLAALPDSVLINVLVDIVTVGGKLDDLIYLVAIEPFVEVERIVSDASDSIQRFNDGQREAAKIIHDTGSAYQQYIDRFISGTGYAIQDQNALNLEAEEYHFQQQQIITAERIRQGLAAGGKQDLIDSILRTAALKKLNQGYGDLSQTQQSQVIQQAAFAQQLSNVNMLTLDYVSTLDGQALAMYRASEAATNLAITTDNLTTAEQSFGGVASAFQSQASQYTSDMQSLADAKDAIIAKTEQGIPITAQDQALLDQYDGIYARLEGGVSDAVIQEGLAITAKNNLMLAQEELNQAVSDGVSDLGPYEQKLKDAEAVLQNADPNSPFKQAMEDLGTVITDDLVGAIAELSRQIDLLDGVVGEPTVHLETGEFGDNIAIVGDEIVQISSKTATPTVDLDTAPFDGNLSNSNIGLTEFDGTIAVSEADLDKAKADEALRVITAALAAYDLLTPTATANADTATAQGNVDILASAVGGLDGDTMTVYAYADTSAAVAAIEGLSAMIPRSPAKEGPFKVLPNWQAVFEEMGPAASQWTEEALDHLQNYVNAASSIFDAYGKGLSVGQQLAEGLGLPTDAQLAELRDRAAFAVSVIQDTAAQFSTEGLDGATEFANAGRAIFDLFGAVLSAFGGDDLVFPSNDQISQLKFSIEHAVRSIQDTALVMDVEGVEAAGVFAASASVVMELIGAGADAFGGFDDLRIPSDAKISRLKFAIEHAVRSIEDTAATFSEDGLASATRFATAGEAVMGALGGFVDAFNAEGGIRIPNDAVISRLKFAIEHAVRSIQDTALVMDEDGVAAAQRFADAAGPVLDLLGQGVDAFTSLAELDTTDADARRGVQAIASLTLIAVDAMERAAAGMSTQGLTAASTFADASASSLSLLTSGVEAFGALDDLVLGTDVTAGVRAIVALSEEAVAAIIEASAGIDSDGLDAAQQYADAAGSVLGLISSGVTGLADLGDAKFTTKVDQGLDRFLRLVDTTVRKVAAAAARMDADAIASAQAYADAAGSVVDLISVGSDDFGGLREFATAVNRDMDAFVAGIEKAIQKLNALEGRIGSDALDSAVEIARDLNEIMDLLSFGGGSSGGSGSGGSSSGGGGGFGGGRRGRGGSPVPTTHLSVLAPQAGATTLYAATTFVVDGQDIASATSRYTLAELSGQLPAGVK